jgi:hypothetical protein
MSSGSYPLHPTSHEGGKRLAHLAAELRTLLDGAWEHGGSPLPNIADNTPEDAASDGEYQGYLRLAVEFIERCLQKPQ